MRLNLPFLDQLDSAQHILIAGAGGGFDVFAGLPIYFTLQEMGKTVHLANYSFTPWELMKLVSKPLEILPKRLVGAQGNIEVPVEYYPEGYLSEWFAEKRHEDVTVWMLPNEGVIPLREGYAALLEHLGQIDALILVDGGVDSIMRGDEDGAGTLIEDSITLCAVKPLPIPVKILACIGFGTEIEEGLCHRLALENIANLTKAGGFWGSCALTPQMEAFQLYEKASRYVWEKPNHKKSHISTRIIPAANGEFGYHAMYPDTALFGGNIPVWHNPLMALYWFFDADVVIKQSYLMGILETTHTKQDAFMRYSLGIGTARKRECRELPY